jgi:hypothetical protein
MKYMDHRLVPSHVREEQHALKVSASVVANAMRWRGAPGLESSLGCPKTNCLAALRGVYPGRSADRSVPRVALDCAVVYFIL